MCLPTTPVGPDAVATGAAGLGPNRPSYDTPVTRSQGSVLDHRHGTSRPGAEAAPGPAACARAKTQRRAGRGARRATTRPAARTALRDSARAAAARLSATGAAHRGERWSGRRNAGRGQVLHCHILALWVRRVGAPGQVLHCHILALWTALGTRLGTTMLNQEKTGHSFLLRTGSCGRDGFEKPDSPPGFRGSSGSFSAGGPTWGRSPPESLPTRLPTHGAPAEPAGAVKRQRASEEPLADQRATREPLGSWRPAAAYQPVPPACRGFCQTHFVETSHNVRLFACPALFWRSMSWKKPLCIPQMGADGGRAWC